MFPRFRSVVIAVQLVALSACGRTSDAPLTPAPHSTARRLVVSGGSQTALVGDFVPDQVVVQLADSSGRAVAEQRPLRFSIVLGGGSTTDTNVVTNANGVAAVKWRLGPASGRQQLAVSLAESDANAIPATLVDAFGVALDAADLVVINGLTSGSAGVLIQEDHALETYALSWPDTVLRFLNRESKGVWQQVTVFSVGHPPEARVRPWTERVDTVRLVLRAPIAVPFTIWSTQNLDTTAAKSSIDLANMDAFWRSHMTGLVVGKIRIESAPALRNAGYCRDVPGSSVADPAAINVYYLGVQPESGNSGYNCSPGIVLIGTNSPLGFQKPGDLLLAHETGHALSLDHLSNPSTVMYPVWPPANGLTTGQIYWMHFNGNSALNVVLGIHPAAEHNCALPLAAQRYCPAQELTVW